MSSKLNKSSSIKDLSENTIAKVEGLIDRPEQVKNIDEVDLKCMSCDKLLLTIMQVSKTGELNKFQCTCPFCGSKSWKQELGGRIKISNPSYVVVENFEFIDDYTLIKLNKV